MPQVLAGPLRGQTDRVGLAKVNIAVRDNASVLHTCESHVGRPTATAIWAGCAGSFRLSADRGRET
jgi:hypothetical protein